MNKTIAVLIIVLALVGVADASYLTAEHYSGGAVTCSIGGEEIGDCNSVLDSEYAEFFGVPVALGGALYYFFILILGSFLLTSASKRIVQVISLITGVGFLASAWFVYLMLFVLEAVCFYCLVSATTTTILFLLSLILLKQHKPSEKPTEQSNQG